MSAGQLEQGAGIDAVTTAQVFPGETCDKCGHSFDCERTPFAGLAVGLAYTVEYVPVPDMDASPAATICGDCHAGAVSRMQSRPPGQSSPRK